MDINSVVAACGDFDQYGFMRKLLIDHCSPGMSDEGGGPALWFDERIAWPNRRKGRQSISTKEQVLNNLLNSELSSHVKRIDQYRFVIRDGLEIFNLNMSDLKGGSGGYEDRR